MKITVLGSGTAIPDPARGPAGFLVTVGDYHVLVDGGSGTLQRCVAAGVDPTRLDGGLFTHHHPDHCADLVPLLFAMRVRRRERDYPIVAGAGFGAFFDRLTHCYGDWITPGSGSVRITELPLRGEGVAALGPLTIRSRPAAHSAGALHLSLEADGRRVVLSGDTAWSDALIELATDADLLICECAGSDDDPVPGHLCPREVAALVAAAQPRRVWLHHLYPHVDPVAAVATVARAGVPTEHAYDGQRG